MPLAARTQALIVTLTECGFVAELISAGQTEHEILVTRPSGWAQQLHVTQQEVAGPDIGHFGDDTGHQRLIHALTTRANKHEHLPES